MTFEHVLVSQWIPHYSRRLYLPQVENNDSAITRPPRYHVCSYLTGETTLFLTSFIIYSYHHRYAKTFIELPEFRRARGH
jgi:hypothetical protein